jgi:hypothetical protein
VRKLKYDETADVELAIQKYIMGLPFNRIAKWQKLFGVPIPASTQWERVQNLGNSIYKVFEALIIFASNGEVCFADDTRAKILDLKKKMDSKNAKRKGIFTTGVVSKVKGRIVNLFFTGNKHAG